MSSKKNESYFFHDVIPEFVAAQIGTNSSWELFLHVLKVFCRQRRGQQSYCTFTYQGFALTLQLLHILRVARKFSLGFLVIWTHQSKSSSPSICDENVTSHDIAVVCQTNGIFRLQMKQKRLILSISSPLESLTLFLDGWCCSSQWMANRSEQRNDSPQNGHIQLPASGSSSLYSSRGSLSWGHHNKSRSGWKGHWIGMETRYRSNIGTNFWNLDPFIRYVTKYSTWNACTLFTLD